MQTSMRESDTNVLYSFEPLRGDIFEWLSKTANNPLLSVETIELHQHSGAKTNLIGAPPGVMFRNHCRENRAENVLIIGDFETKPIVIGLNLRARTPILLARKNEMADCESLARLLGI